MILTLIDGRETVFLAIVLKAIAENKRILEILELFVEREKAPGLLDQIRKFARSKLEHPVLKLALEEMEELLTSYQEKKTKYQRK